MTHESGYDFANLPYRTCA
ncbi:BnaC05g00600D [Brassica napus]|uniref:BnaC05g00600D protein n=1 Tax=Brassica napus TaxID=3708 RepID=A0A078FPY4_BRANA|nr:BnaC05g00600D [Brassica napus]